MQSYILVETVADGKFSLRVGMGCLNGAGATGTVERLFNNLGFGMWMGSGIVGFLCVTSGEVSEAVSHTTSERVPGSNCSQSPSLSLSALAYPPWRVRQRLSMSLLLLVAYSQ